MNMYQRLIANGVPPELAVEYVAKHCAEEKQAEEGDVHPVKKLRLQKGMTQKELAFLLDVDQVTISQWENGRNNSWMKDKHYSKIKEVCSW